VRSEGCEEEEGGGVLTLILALKVKYLGKECSWKNMNVMR